MCLEYPFDKGRSSYLFQLVLCAAAAAEPQTILGGDDEVGVFLVDKLLEDTSDEDDLDSRRTAMALLYTLLLEEGGDEPPLPLYCG